MGKTLKKNITVHAQAEDGSHQTFRLRKGEEVPDFLVERISDPDAWEGGTADPTSGEDLIGESAEDPLLSRTNAELLAASEQWGIEGVSSSNTKKELVAAIRSAGYDGDGSDLPTEGK